MPQDSSLPNGVVSDTGPFISLERMKGGFKFLRKLHDRVLIPPQVLDELAVGHGGGQAYLAHFGLGDFVEVVTAPPPSITLKGLDFGEQYAISLAMDRKFALLIEDQGARAIARSLGLVTSGIAGQVLAALRRGIIGEGEALDHFQSLLAGGRINRRLFEELVNATSAHSR